MEKRFVAESVEETWAVAAEVAAMLRPGTVLALHGDLGAGKTTFMQGLGLALGLRRPVTSPTFTVSVEYETPRFKLVHMDLYRTGGLDDLSSIGYSEYIENGAVVAVEWPERAGALIPEDAVHVRFRLTETPDKRIIEVSQCGNGL